MEPSHPLDGSKTPSRHGTPGCFALFAGKGAFGECTPSPPVESSPLHTSRKSFPEGHV